MITHRFSGLTIKLVLAVTLLTLGGVAFGTSAAMANNGNSNHTPDELLVQFNAGVSAEKVKGLLKSHGATEVDENGPIRVHRIHVPSNALDNVKAALSKNPNVSFVEYNYIAEGGSIPNDADFPSQWHLPKISAPAGWDIETGVATEPIAIIDSGVDATHPDLAGKVIGGYNFLSNDVYNFIGLAPSGTASNNYELVCCCAGCEQYHGDRFRYLCV
jgi:subtilisin family serine protease